MQVLNIFHVLIAIGLIVFVLIQRGQGATAGAAFGSGASGTVFGSRGAGNFLSRSTWVLAALFCTISLTMAVMVSRMMAPTEPNLGVVSPAVQEAPAVEESTQPEQIVVGPDESAVSDMPVFNTVEDIPATDEAVENVTDEEIPAFDGGEDNPDQSTDGG